jgi:hypothetical protein
LKGQVSKAGAMPLIVLNVFSQGSRSAINLPMNLKDRVADLDPGLFCLVWNFTSQI